MDLKMIDVEDLHVRFGAKEAVHDLTFRVQPGEVYGLLGPNGAGKTTTLRALAGLLRLAQGRVRVAGFDPQSSREEVLRRMGVVMANTPLPEKMTGREALRFYGGFYDLPDLEGRIALLEAQLDMPYLDQPISDYSTGMRQRVSIARALLHEPRVLALDEATNGLDVKSRLGVLEFIREQKAKGTTVVYATHILAEAESICDRVGIIDQGRLIAEGTVQELLERTRQPNLELAYLALASQAEVEEVAA